MKKLLRQTLCQLRKNLSAEYQQEASRKICDKLRHLNAFQTAKTISFYWPQKGEIDLNGLWQSALKQQKQCYFPIVRTDKTLSFGLATSNTPFVKNHYGIPEPQEASNEMIDVDNLDIMLIPLVAFDHLGTRLGMGGGYFDRTLAIKRPALLIGVAYEFQRQPILTRNVWDIGLDAVITEKTIDWIM